VVFQGMQNLPLFAAQSNGLFAKRGLAIDIQIAPSSEEMRAGLADASCARAVTLPADGNKFGR
jgi:ABC-type nitrate/sulfonate/bicarbonate transport system substrate-binding protein